MFRQVIVVSFLLVILLQPTTALSTNWDFDGDGKVGLSEAIMALQTTADIRVELNELLGVWGYGEANGDYNTLIFFENGFYIVACPQGEEYGAYNYNKETGALGLVVYRDHNGQYGLADSGVPYPDKVVVNGEQLDVYENNVYQASFFRVLDRISPIIGMWTKTFSPGDTATLYFYPNGQYAVDHNGVEEGLYEHDNATGDFQIRNITDNNGQYGLADNGSPYGDTITVSGDVLNVSGEVTFTRVK
jgi:hypothetical protein